MSLAEPVATLERIGRAMVSTNLKEREHSCDLDFVIATGMVGQHHKEAVNILRFHLVGDSPSYRGVRGAAISITHKLNVKRRWGMNPKDLVRVAEIAMKLYLNPRCPKCQGRKFQLVDGTPSLSNRHCQKCQGTGKRGSPEKDRDRIADVVQVLTSIVDLAAQCISRKTRSY